MLSYWPRVQIFPNLGTFDSTFKARWEDNLLACSHKMMRLLIGEYRKILISIDKDINELFLQHPNIVNQPSFKDKDIELSLHLDRFNMEIIGKKRSEIFPR